jgi:hypothetical protein
MADEHEPAVEHCRAAAPGTTNIAEQRYVNGRTTQPIQAAPCAGLPNDTQPNRQQNKHHPTRETREPPLVPLNGAPART